MKLKFSKNVLFIPAWEGNLELHPSEQISMRLKPVEFEDLMLIMDAMGGSKVMEAYKEDGVDGAQKMLDATALLKAVKGIIPKYTSELTNLNGEEGPLTINDIVVYPNFMGLAIEIIMKLTNISMSSEETEKNSEGQPG
jgi:hypothetical protein